MPAAIYQYLINVNVAGSQGFVSVLLYNDNDVKKRLHEKENIFLFT